MTNTTAICAARKSSGLTQSEMAIHLGISLGTYRKIEFNPQFLTVGNLVDMLEESNGISVKILHDWLDDIFLPYE